MSFAGVMRAQRPRALQDMHALRSRRRAAAGAQHSLL